MLLTPYTLTTRPHRRAHKAISSSCLAALSTRKQHSNNVSPNQPLKLSLSPPPLQAQSSYGGGDCLRISNSTQIMSRYYTATINRQFDWLQQPHHVSKRRLGTLIYIITGFDKKLNQTMSIWHTYRPAYNLLTVLQNCCLVSVMKIG